MDADRFDTFTKRLDRSRTRRSALRVLTATPLAGLLSLATRHLAMAAAPRVIKAPRVITKSATSVTIGWSTDVDSDSLARYGTTHTYNKDRGDIRPVVLGFILTGCRGAIPHVTPAA